MTTPATIPLLLVEDDPMYAAILKRLIPTLEQDVTFAITWVDTAAKARAELANQAYDLVLLDYRLPGEDGLEVLADIQRIAKERQPAVIMLTGMGSEAIAVQAMKSGAADYLAKDQTDVASLTRAITGSLQRRRLEAQVATTTRELRIRNEQFQADLLLAGEIQQALLPQQLPRFPADATEEQSWLRFASRYQPTATVGGDFFDVLALSDRQAGVFICDVMGHGVRAALVTAILGALVEEYRPLASDPGPFLAKISTRLLTILKQNRRPIFASAFYLVLDTESGELLFANAGHASPVHVRAAEQTAGYLEGKLGADPGPALGVFEQADYRTDSCQVREGDRLLMYTDGVFEATDAANRQFGEERLLEAVRARLGLGADQLCDEVLGEIRAFSASDTFVDDVCLVGLEVKRLGRAANR